MINKREEWVNTLTGCEKERQVLYNSLKDFTSLDAVATDRTILAMEELNAEIRKAKGVIKRIDSKRQQ